MEIINFQLERKDNKNYNEIKKKERNAGYSCNHTLIELELGRT